MKKLIVAGVACVWLVAAAKVYAESLGWSLVQQATVQGNTWQVYQVDLCTRCYVVQQQQGPVGWTPISAMSCVRRDRCSTTDW